MKVSRVVLIVVALHVVVIGGIFVFEGCSRAGKPTVVAENSDDMTPSDAQTANQTAATLPAATTQNLTPAQGAAAIATPAIPTAVPQPVAQPAPVARTYTVKSGDYLMKIAKLEGVSIVELAKANNLTKTSTLRIGQKLQIPVATKVAEASVIPTPSASADLSATGASTLAADAGGSLYSVQSGDSLWKIARNQHTTVDAIKKANGLTADALKIGQKLHIPAATATSADNAAAGHAGIATSALDWHEPGNAVENGQNIHYVDIGESPDKIARKHGIKVEALMKANNITDPKKLRVGQRLVIPDAQATSVAAAAPAPTTAPVAPAPAVPTTTPALRATTPVTGN